MFGSSTAGGAYHPALSDYTIFVKDQAQVFLGGPPLVKMATGEIAEAEELGGADMHSTVTGLSDQLAIDEYVGFYILVVSQADIFRLDAIRKAREWVMTISAARTQAMRVKSAQEVREPRYDVQELFGIIDPDIRQPLDMREILLRIVDDSRVEEFKPLYGRGMITAWAHIHGLSSVPTRVGNLLRSLGHLMGIIANQHPVILPNESDKATHFIGLCNQG